MSKPKDVKYMLKESYETFVRADRERQVESKDRKCRVDRVFETYEG